VGSTGPEPGHQVVYIVTPNGLHLYQVEGAARVGKHVLCEKQMANTSSEAEQMVAACAEAKVILEHFPIDATQ
jgi:predicted dehydrogenase